jgi:peptidoglycan/LPS O-acetylase OafA/YrhL
MAPGLEQSIGMRKGFAAVIAFLFVMAWQYRNKRAVFFLIVGALFASAAALNADRVPDRILQALALGWVLCMLVAGVSAAANLASRLRKKTKHSYLEE